MSAAVRTWAVVVLLLTTLACGNGGGSPSSPDPTAVDVLAGQLRAAGLPVTRGGQVLQPFFAVPGELLVAGTTQIQAFAFPTTDAAAAAAARVAPDGGTIGTTSVFWVAPPHFYRSGAIVALYVGSDAATLDALQRVLGSQFAGR